MGFQKGTPDFSMNDALRAYLKESKIRTPKERLEFSKLVDIQNQTLIDILSDRKPIGMNLQARLFTGTGDKRFGPRNKAERTVLEEWKQNPHPKKIKIAHGARATALSPKPDNPYYLHERLQSLLNDYGFGIKTGPEFKILNDHLKMGKGCVLPLLRKQAPFTVLNKVRTYLGFNDPDFAPMDENERTVCEQWLREIPKPLPFVKNGATPEQLAAQSKLAKQDKITPAEDELGEVEQRLLGNARFLRELADELSQYLGSSKPEKPIAVTTSDDFVSAEFVSATSTIIETATLRLATIITLSKDQRKKVQKELEEKLPQLERKLGELFLTVRALAKTATGQAAAKILESERNFVKQFKPVEEEK